MSLVGVRDIIGTTRENSSIYVVSAVVESMKEHNYARYKIAGIAVIDKEMTGKYVDGVKVVANIQD